MGDGHQRQKASLRPGIYRRGNRFPTAEAHLLFVSITATSAKGSWAPVTAGAILKASEPDAHLMPLSCCGSTSEEEAARILAATTCPPAATIVRCLLLAVDLPSAAFGSGGGVADGACLCFRAEVLSLQVVETRTLEGRPEFSPRNEGLLSLCVSYPVPAPREERNEFLEDCKAGYATQLTAKRRRTDSVTERHGCRSAYILM